MGSLGQPYRLPTPHPHPLQSTLTSTPSHARPPSLQSLTWKEREEGVLDTGLCAPGHTAVAAWGGISVGCRPQPGFLGSLPLRSCCSPLTCPLGPQTQRSLQPGLSQSGRCNWGKGRHRAWGDLGSAGPLGAWVQAAEGEDEGWAEGVSRLAPGWAGS